MICDLCGLRTGHTKTCVLQGKFGSYCNHCVQGAKRMESVGYANYSRDRDREDNARDLLQPRDRLGKPNKEFIKEYPQQSKEIFTKKELKENE